MILIGSSGKRYSAQERIPGGGEGDIYLIEGDIYHVIKVYKQPKSENEEKLKVMVRSNLVNSDLVTWPQDVVYTESGRFKGYVMNRIHGGVPISDVYQYGNKSVTKNMPWAHRVIIAINLCCALDELHESGHVIGDFNPNNMFINLKSGHIKLIDTDSYHIQANNKTYRCTVGMANYLAPEILRKTKGGETLETVPLPTFTKASDNFVLAIHIFQLLMNGAHPYQGALRTDSPDDMALPPIKDNIKAGMVPHINPSSEYIVTPSYAPPFKWLPTSIKMLFNKAFIQGTANPNVRPDAKEWHKALTYYYNQLKQCSKDKLHTYYRGAPECPLCYADNNFRNVFARTINESRNQNNETKTLTKGIQYRKTNYPEAMMIISPYAYIPGGMNKIFDEIINTLSPVDERFVLKLYRKLSGLSRLTEGDRRSATSQLRRSKTYVTDGDFVTYVKDRKEYDTYKDYRVPKYGRPSLQIEDMSYLDIRNAMYSVLKERSLVDKDTLISETAHRLGFSRAGTKIHGTLEKIIRIAVKKNEMSAKGPYYKIN